MSNGFSFYEGTTSENTNPKITVRKGGQLVLTSGAVDMLGEGVEYVQLAYNRTKGIVGIRSADESAKGRYRLRTQKSSGSCLVTGKRFFNHYELTIDRAQTFDAEEFADGIVGFKLTEEVAETPAPKTGGRRKAKAA